MLWENQQVKTNVSKKLHCEQKSFTLYILTIIPSKIDHFS